MAHSWNKFLTITNWKIIGLILWLYIHWYINLLQINRPAIERPGLEKQRSRKRLFFHRKIFKFFKYINLRLEKDFCMKPKCIMQKFYNLSWRHFRVKWRKRISNWGLIVPTIYKFSDVINIINACSLIQY